MPENFAILNLAQSHHRAGDLLRAIKSYSEFLKSELNHLQANCLKASALQASNRSHEAITHYLIAHQESPNDPAITLEIALCFSKIGNLDRSNFFTKKQSPLILMKLEHGQILEII